MSDIIARLCFHKKGKPRRWMRKILVQRDGEIRPALRRIVFKKNGKPRPRFSSWLLAGTTTPNKASVREYLELRNGALRPLTVFQETNPVHRVNLVTDSIGPSSLFGGVGTAIIIAALWANKTNSVLRIITRTETPQTSALASILQANNINIKIKVEFEYAPHFGGSAISVSQNDIFMATSWWTARCLLNTVPAKRIVYLLQEDERMFYPFGDDHLACTSTMSAPFALVLVNSEILHKHLTEGGSAIQNQSSQYMYFEPAFTYPPRRYEFTPERKQKLFFYARPHNPRNLYLTGLRLINQAVLNGVLDPKKWELHAVGKGLEELVFDNDLSSFNHAPMAWKDYVDFLQDMDAGFSLMYTPHPSYPPLDLAAIGVPVLTNTFGIKTDLKMYSENIICKELNTEAMMQGFQELSLLAENIHQCTKLRSTDRIQRDWEVSLAPVITKLSELIGKDC
jgi:O-antigen biosynthesis protein